jgi:hypothetical protein
MAVKAATASVDPFIPAGYTCRVFPRANDQEFILHQRMPGQAPAFRDKSCLRFLVVDDEHIGFSETPQTQGAPGSDYLDIEVISGGICKRRLKHSQKPRTLDAGGCSESYQAVIRHGPLHPERWYGEEHDTVQQTR